jgi:DNA-binding LytR/AlgR family response regulator
MKVLIIEDEIKTARELKRLLEQYSHDLEVLDVVTSIKSSIKWFQENSQPDLILSDIQLADGLSFEIFNKIENSPPIIFCTAFDEFAIRAFETNGIDYLLKPIEEARLNQALAKYIQLRTHLNTEPHPFEQRLKLLLQSVKNTYKSTFLINEGEKITPVSVSDVAYIYLGDSALTICCKNQKQYNSSQFRSLDEIESLLDPAHFFRANRQYIISRTVVNNAEYYFNRRLIVKLNVATPEDIIVSKTKSASFLEWWGK